MRVPYPKIEVIRRRRPGELSKGDIAIASTTTGLIDFVDDLAAADMEGARSFSLRHSIPSQLGGASFAALLAPTRVSAGEGWAAFRSDVRWFQLPGRNETLRTLAEAESITPATARFSFTATAGNVKCATGVVHYVRLRDGVNLSTGKMIVPPEERPALRSAVARPNAVDHRYSPFLVQLLMNTISGGAEPLGRRLHPLSSIPLGAAVFQAMQVLPEKRVASATIKYISPMPIEAGFLTSTVLEPGGQAVVSFTGHSGSPFAVCYLKE